MGIKIRHRLFKVLGLMSLIGLGALSWRLYSVQKRIDNAPIEITDLSKSGYTPEGVYGHGDLIGEAAGQGWYIYDIPVPNGLVRKVCTQNTVPDPSWDIDFIYHEKAWYKLRSGTAEMSGAVLIVTPENSTWKAGLQSKTAFPVRRPDLPYRFKIIYSKLKYESLSPLEYLQSLKAGNPSCADMPTP